MLLTAIVVIVINCFAIVKELPIIPLLTGAAGLVYLLIFHVDWVMYLMAFLTPLSVALEIKDYKLGLSFPGEIVMIAVTFLFLCRILYDLSLDRKLLRHPISIAIFVYLTWMFLTCLTSEIPLVSFKFWAAKIWFTTACYWMTIQLIKDDNRNLLRYFNSYAVALAIVVIITTIKHARSGFDDNYAHWVMDPFYNDHTAYGAVLAFFLPISACCFFLPENNIFQKFFYAALSLIFMVGFYLSFSRAAWISLVVAIGVFVVLKLRIKLSWLVAAGLVLGTAFYFYADDILYKMSRNSQDSSGNFTEQLQSMSNITTDASNVERLNRWNSAFGMIRERPVVGWASQPPGPTAGSHRQRPPSTGAVPRHARDDGLAPPTPSRGLTPTATDTHPRAAAGRGERSPAAHRRPTPVPDTRKAPPPRPASGTPPADGGRGTTPT